MLSGPPFAILNVPLPPMPQHKILALETPVAPPATIVVVDGTAPGAVPRGEVPTLDHEAGHEPAEGGIKVSVGYGAGEEREEVMGGAAGGGDLEV